MKYHPLYTFMPTDKPAYYVVMGDYVTTEDGTGLVHTAPAFGQEDMETGKKYDLPVLMTVLPDGTFMSEVTPWRVCSSKTPTAIIEDCGAWLFKSEAYTHVSILLAL
jgi:isoleucyl-tRNA synthetase